MIPVFKPIKSLNSFAKIVGCDLKSLQEIASQAEGMYRIRYESKTESKQIRTQKPESGNWRKIEAPTGSLKAIQTLTLKRVLGTYQFSPCVVGGIKGSDNIRNARFHLGNKYHFYTDIRYFYPSVTCAAIRDALIRIGFSPKVAQLVTRLCTYEGHLPTGAPTSSCLANLVMQPIDEKIFALAKKHGLKYTRYLDDIVISGQILFADLCGHVLSIVRSYGYKIAYRKTRFTGSLDHRIVTGVPMTNNRLYPLDRHIHLARSKDIPADSRQGYQNYIDRIYNCDR